MSWTKTQYSTKNQDKPGCFEFDLSITTIQYSTKYKKKQRAHVQSKTQLDFKFDLRLSKLQSSTKKHCKTRILSQAHAFEF